MLNEKEKNGELKIIQTTDNPKVTLSGSTVQNWQTTVSSLTTPNYTQTPSMEILFKRFNVSERIGLLVDTRNKNLNIYMRTGGIIYNPYYVQDTI